MDRIAFINEETFLYWSQIILTLAIVAAIAIYAAFYLAKSRNYLALCVSVALSVILSFPLSRLIHWYCRSGAYGSFAAAMTDYSAGGYALIGVFAACLIAVGVCRLLRLTDNAGQMLDYLCIGGGVGIAVGRLAALFNADGQGITILPDSVGFPWAWPVINPVSGATENRLAIFMLQSILATAIVLGLLIYMLCCKLRKKPAKDGEVALFFMLFYGFAQVVCDSMRKDTLTFPFNDFVHLIQICSLAIALVPVVLFSIRMVKRYTLRWWQFLFWVGIAGMLGGAGYMEYYFQRHPPLTAMCHSIMSGCVIGVIAIALVMRFLAQKPAKVEVATPATE